MCWVGNAEEEEEDDIFKDIQGDFTDTKNTLTLTEFTLSNKLKELFSIAESNHKLFIGKWFIRANSRNIVRDSSRAYLYDIRD